MADTEAGCCKRPVRFPGVEDENSCGGSCSEKPGKAQWRLIKALGFCLVSSWAKETGVRLVQTCQPKQCILPGSQTGLSYPGKGQRHSARSTVCLISTIIGKPCGLVIVGQEQDIKKGLCFIGKQARGLCLAFLRPAMLTATCQEEMPSCAAGAAVIWNSGWRGHGRCFHFAWFRSFLLFVSRSGYPDLVKVSPVWPIPSSAQTSLRSIWPS